ncbi:MAG TPA: hypothetical protein VMT15_20115 [Bryobacteraceae bacterium]|nr:hypothetical protein [Bryobacteraceae bacterium]
MKTLVRIVLALAAAVGAGWYVYHRIPAPLPLLSRQELLEEVRQGHVHEVVIEDQDTIEGVSSTRGGFRSPYRKDQDANLPQELRNLGVIVKFASSGVGLF